MKNRFDVLWEEKRAGIYKENLETSSQNFKLQITVDLTTLIWKTMINGRD